MAISVKVDIYKDIEGSPATLVAEDYYTVGIDGNVKITVGNEVFYINNTTLLRLGVAMASKYLKGLEAWWYQLK